MSQIYCLNCITYSDFRQGQRKNRSSLLAYKSPWMNLDQWEWILHEKGFVNCLLFSDSLHWSQKICYETCKLEAGRLGPSTKMKARLGQSRKARQQVWLVGNQYVKLVDTPIITEYNTVSFFPLQIHNYHDSIPVKAKYPWDDLTFV